MDLELSRRAILTSAAIGAAATAFPAPIFGKDKEPELGFGPGPGVAQLSRNENPYGPAPSALKAITATAMAGSYYTEGPLKTLKAMIAERFGLAPENVAIGSGSTEVLCAIAMIQGMKGKIVAPELFWDSTTSYAERKGARIVRVALKPDMDVDLDGIAAAVTPDVAMVHICNPNNPTGILISGDAMRGFVRKIGPKALVLVDEAYNELTNAPEASSVSDLVKAGENVVVTRTFSKIYGMAGLRIGYALGKPELIAQVQSYLMNGGINASGLAAAIASYNDTAFTHYSKQQILDARGIILDAVRKAGLVALPSQTNFVYVKVADADVVRKIMADKNIMIRGTYGKWKQWSRVSTGRIEDVKRYALVLPEAVRA